MKKLTVGDSTKLGIIEDFDDKYFYVRDILGNIYGIINSSGNYIIKYDYTAYGEVTKDIIASSGDDLVVANHNPFMYKGYYYDEDLECYYLKSRFYMPSICRFISPDDHSYLDYEDLRGINLYCYCYDNPVMYIDPEGSMPKWAKWVVGGLAIAGLVVATVLTFGAAGAGAAVVGAAMLTGGIVSGTINALDQLHDGDKFDFTELAISTLSGMAYGAVVASTGGAGAVLGKLAVAGGTSLLNSWNNNADLKDTMMNFGVALSISAVAQLGGHLVGKYGPNILSKFIKPNPNYVITLGDIISAAWDIPAVKTGVIRLFAGCASAKINDF